MVAPRRSDRTRSLKRGIYRNNNYLYNRQRREPLSLTRDDANRYDLDVIDLSVILEDQIFDPTLKMARWNNVRDNRATAPADILAITDSIGVGASVTVLSERYLTKLLNSLRIKYPTPGVAGGEGYVSAYYNATFTDGWTWGGNYTFNQGYGWGHRSLMLNPTSGSGAGFCQRVFFGTSVDINYLEFADYGTFRVLVDGVPVATQSAVGTGAFTDAGRLRVTFTSRGSHTVRIEHFSGTGSVFINGLTAYDQDENAGIRLTESGEGGSDTADWSPVTNPAGALYGDRIAQLQPSLVLIELGVNDWYQNVPPTTFKQNLLDIIQFNRDKTTIDPSFRLIANYTLAQPGGVSYVWQEYVTAMREIADSMSDVSLVDLSLVSNPGIAFGYDSTDGVHPNNAGHTLYAQMVYDSLVPTFTGLGTAPVQVDHIADADLITVTTTPQTLVQPVIRTVSLITVTNTPEVIDLEKSRIVGLIDSTVQLPAVEVEITSFVSLDIIDVAITPDPVELEKIIDLPFALVINVNSTIVSIPINVASIVDVGIIDITVTPQPVISFRSYRVLIVDISTPLLAIELEKVIDLFQIDTSDTTPVVDLAHSVDTVRITSFITLPDVAVQKFDDTPILVQIQIPSLDVGKSSESFSFIQDLQPIPFQDTARFIAQDIRTGEFLHWELPISNPAIDYNLSGPVVISGSFDNEVRQLEDVGLEPLATWIHVEEGGVIRASGILQPTNSDGNQQLSFEALGPASYPAGLPYQGSYTNINVDPADVVRHLWAHIQGYPDGNLGVAVTGNTTVRIGKPFPPEIPSGEEDPNPNDNQDKPYSLQWYEAPDMGDEINKLLQDAKVDYVERYEWNSTRTDVNHFIDIKSPRAGNKRDDVTFVQEENLIAAIAPKEIEGFYASTVVLFGKGEGSSIILGYASAPNPRRLRRVVILNDPTVDNKDRATALCLAELTRRQAIFDIDEILADARHPNAQLGDFQLGDDVLVKANLPKFGEINQWQRIIGYTYYPDTEQLRIRMRRSDSFVYGTGARF